jgi:ESCRT-II complex subunit VPS22
MAHRRRGVGVGRTGGAGTKNATLLLQRKADEIKAQSFQSAVETVERLQIQLAEYAKKHQSDIQDDPAFRQQFLQMCGPLGVDPLVSSKGFWAKTLGVGKFLSGACRWWCLASSSPFFF